MADKASERAMVRRRAADREGRAERFKKAAAAIRKVKDAAPIGETPKRRTYGASR